MVNGLNGYSNQDIMLQEARRKALAAQQNGYVQQTNESIMPQNQPAKSDNVVGKDDGKIGFGKGLLSFGKGILNFFGGLIGFDRNGHWSPSRLLKNAAIGAGIAGICLLTGGTAIPAMIAGAGVGTAGWGLLSSQYKFWTAKTDAQAIAAMEDTGSNTLALGLSLVGAKATMRQVPGVDAAKYKGFMGTLRAGWDSTTIGFSKGFSALKTGYKVYRDGGGFQTLRTLVSKNLADFKNTVITNYKDATKLPTLEEQQTNRVKQYEDRITKLQEKVNTTKDNKVKASLEAEIKKLGKEKTTLENAYNKINSETTFANAQGRINKLQDAISILKRKVESTTNAELKAKYESMITKYEQKMETYQSVLKQKTIQARNLRAKIETLEKVKDKTPEQIVKLGELKAQQAKLNFELPKRSEYETFSKNVVESSKKVLESREKYDKATQEFTAAEKAYNKFKEGDTSAEATTARTKMNTAKKAVEDSHKDLMATQIENSSNQALQSAASGADYKGTFLPKAVQFFKTFNNKYGTEGQKIASTRFSIPSISTLALPATGELGIPVISDMFGLNIKVDNFSVGGSSLDEMSMQELQNEQMAQYQQAGTGIATGTDYAQYQQMMNEYQAAVNEINALRAAQAQAYPQTQAYPQQVAGQPRNIGMDMQNLDYIMKAYGFTA